MKEERVKPGLTDEERSQCNKVKKRMIAYFGDDTGWINHSLEVTEYAKKIYAMENGGDRLVVECSGYLHDIGVVESMKKHGSVRGPLQEEEGPPVAREIMTVAGVDEKRTEEVCAIIGSHHSPGEIETLNFKILWDADCMVNSAEKFSKAEPEAIRTATEKTFMTASGKKLALSEYLEE